MADSTAALESQLQAEESELAALKEQFLAVHTEKQALERHNDQLVSAIRKSEEAVAQRQQRGSDMLRDLKAQVL